jgi:hypothetical protein
MEDYIISREVAEIVRRPESTLAYWRHTGQGPRFARVGKRVLYRRADVLTWLEEQFDKAAAG